MKHRSLIFTLCCLLSYPVAFSQGTLVHDPVMTKEGDTFYVFCTGMGITVYSSKDKVTWSQEKPVFDAPPQWAINAIPDFKGHIWAPDISFHNGMYYLYYSVSAFAKNTSCIGLATNVTLNPKDKKYKWTDHGSVIQSIPGRDLWNAIDPNLAFDESNQPWLVFGSFWSGIKLVKMNANLEAIAQPQEWYTVSKRSRDFKDDDRDPAEGAVEAPFIFKKGNYYYLFVSFDFCCRGAASTYKIMVGRSEKIQGPYLDKDGLRMDQGGGSLVLQGNKAWPGVGHNSAYTFDGTDYIIFHAYDMSNGGKPKLKIEPIQWDEKHWPVVTLHD